MDGIKRGSIEHRKLDDMVHSLRYGIATDMLEGHEDEARRKVVAYKIKRQELKDVLAQPLPGGTSP
jgi:hypothetical protein